MIENALHFIRDQVANYLGLKLDITPGEALRLDNIANLQDGGTAGPTGHETYNTFMSLVNIEEDRISESPRAVHRQGNTLINQHPKVHLNLYLLFAANLSHYHESLKRLSLIIQFFQYRNVFTPLNSPDLPKDTEKLILDLVTLSFQDLNNLWGILGSKYLPSVMYKLRMIKISENFEEGSASPVREIRINDQSIQS